MAREKDGLGYVLLLNAHLVLAFHEANFDEELRVREIFKEVFSELKMVLVLYGVRFECMIVSVQA